MDQNIIFMTKAIEMAKNGKTPFGCVVVDQNDIVVESYNTTSTTNSVINHAEMNAIEKLKGSDLSKFFTLYTTAEPCPMCMGAILYQSNIGRVVFGASINDISISTSQIMVSSNYLAERSFRKIEIIPFVLREECIKLFQ